MLEKEEHTNIGDEAPPTDIMDPQALEEAEAGSGSTGRSFVDGIRDCVPVVLGYVAIGFAFGVVGRTAGLSVMEVGLMSALLYAGSAQFVVTGMLGAAAPAPAIVVTVLLVNLRHFLYSAALAPYARKFAHWQNALIGAELTDETFALASSHLARGVAPSAAWLFGINLTAQTTWVLSTVGGAILGRAISDTRALGLDFALASMFAALLVLQITNRPRVRAAVTVALVGAVIGVGGALIVPASWAIVVAAVAAASAGVLIEGRKPWM